MSTSSKPLRRALVRAGIASAASVTFVLMPAGVAQAHITIQPAAVEGGGFSVIAFRVPNERDDASTTRLRVTLPEDQPIGEVSTTPIPGWSVTTVSRKLDKPVDVEGEQLDTVVSQVTWTATGAGVRPGEYQDFSLSLGQLPDTGQLVFRALQTYSDGEKVNWNEVSTDGVTEPEHPAPTLTLGAATSATGADGHATEGSSNAAAPEATAAEPPATRTDGRSGSTLSIAISLAALAVSLLTALLVWRRGRYVPVEPAPSPVLEDQRM